MMFSIVIPTRARADTLRHALRTVLAQTYHDFEVIVHECGDDPATSATVSEFDDPRIRFFKTFEQVRMTENWERALRHVSGDYVFVLGDDDGLLADACANASDILQAHPSEVLSWGAPIHAHYYWPRFHDSELANRLSVVCATELACTLKSSKSALNLLYRFRASFFETPMIYNSFVSRKLIERVRASRGRYFLGSAPDVTSGVVNLWFTDRFLKCNRPLSIGGASHHSIGHAYSHSGNADKQAYAMYAAFGAVPVHPTMVRSCDLTFTIGNELLIARQELFPDKAPHLNYAEMLRQAAQKINQIPGQYDAVLADCRAIAERNGIVFDESQLPARQPNPRPARQERRDIQGGMLFLDIDGTSRGTSNVFDAAGVLAQELPTPGIGKLDIEPPQLTQIAFGNDNRVALDFSTNGNGALFLGAGWSSLEHWGVWSLGTRADLTFPLPANFGGTMSIQLIGFVFLPPRRMTIRVTMGSRDLLDREITATEARVDLELAPLAIDASDSVQTLEITIGIDRAATPLEAGVAPDSRPVGFGLERVVISDTSEPVPEPIASHERVAAVSWPGLVRRTGAKVLRRLLKPTV
jgi:glycosyltransferase involved in cell wall biosynthesis